MVGSKLQSEQFVFCDGDASGSGLCSVKLLNNGCCRSGTQGRRLDDVGGSTAKGYDGGCDGESDVEKKRSHAKKDKTAKKRSE